MTKSTSKSAHLKKILILPLFAIFFVVFANKKQPEILENNFSISEKNFKERVSLPKNLDKVNLLETGKDTIKPKVKKTEEAIKGKIKRDVLNGKKSKSKELLPPPPPPYPHPKSKVKKGEQLIPPPPPVNKIDSQTDAEFPGGLNAFRDKFSKEFDIRRLENTKGMIKGTINIIVSEDGKNYNASYDFDNEIFKNEAKKAVEKSLEGVVWKPGTLNGKPVAS